MEQAPQDGGTARAAGAAAKAAPQDLPAADARDPERRPPKRRSKALKDVQATYPMAAVPAPEPCGAAGWGARSRSQRSSNAAQGARRVGAPAEGRGAATAAGGYGPLEPHASAQRYTRVGAYEYPCWWAVLY